MDIRLITSRLDKDITLLYSILQYEQSFGSMNVHQVREMALRTALQSIHYYVRPHSWLTIRGSAMRALMTSVSSS
jgi:hypothetical protein